MGRRIIQVTPDLLTSFLKGTQLAPDMKIFFTVMNPLPMDATIKSVRPSPYRESEILVELESDQWKDVGFAEFLSPAPTLMFHAEKEDRDVPY